VTEPIARFLPDATPPRRTSRRPKWTVLGLLLAVALLALGAAGQRVWAGHDAQAECVPSLAVTGATTPDPDVARAAAVALRARGGEVVAALKLIAQRGDAAGRDARHLLRVLAAEASTAAGR